MEGAELEVEPGVVESEVGVGGGGVGGGIGGGGVEGGTGGGGAEIRQLEAVELEVG